MKAFELTEEIAKLCRKSEPARETLADDSQLIADEEEEQSDDIGRWEVASRKEDRMKLFATRPATAGVA